MHIEDVTSIQEYNILPNPDFLHRKKIEEAIKSNDGYCCCALDKNEDTLCMCKDFREQEASGFCHCGRYYKVLKTPRVYLCGSICFEKQFYEVAQELTLKGYTVTMPMLFLDDSNDYLKEVYRSEINGADIIFVLNYDGYISPATREQINWAIELNKKIEYLEPQI